MSCFYEYFLFGVNLLSGFERIERKNLNLFLLIFVGVYFKKCVYKGVFVVIY